MPRPTYPPCVLPAPEFKLTDFWMVVAGGLVAVPLVFALGLFTSDSGWLLAGAALFQYTGHWLALRWVMRRNAAKLADVGFDLVTSDLFYVVAGVAIALVLAYVTIPLQQVLDFEQPPQSVETILTESKGSLQRFVLAIVIALLAPAVEELLFRGILWKSVERRSGRPNAVSAGVFSAFHMTGLDPQNFWKAAALTVPVIFVLGLILGALRRQSGRLGPPIFTHAGYNLLAVLVLLGFVGENPSSLV